MMDYVELLMAAKRTVRASPLWERFIEHTPLENDIAVWMADFADAVLDQQAARASTAGRCLLEGCPIHGGPNPEGQ